MARAYTGAQRNDVGSPTHVTHVLCQIQDPDGIYREITNFLGLDWFISARWGADGDRGFETGTVTLYRYDADSGISLSPEIGASPANRNAAAAYAKFIEVGRGIRWQWAIKPAGVAPIAGDYVPMFDGHISQIGGDDETISLECADPGARLQRAQIDAKTRYGAGGAGQLLEISLQNMLNDWADAPPVISVPVAVGRVVGYWDQDVGSLGEAMRAVAAQGGQDIRYLWDAAGVLRLTYRTLNRAALAGRAADHTIGPGEYLEAKAIEKDVASVRNKAIVRYVRTDGTLGVQTYTDPTSIGKYGRQTAEIKQDKTSTIRTDAEGLALAQMIVGDLKEPPADQQIEMLAYPWIEIGDVVLLLANGVHYDTDQKFAVVSYEHRAEGGEGFTNITTRGTPAGLYRPWIRIGGGGIGGRTPGAFVDPGIFEIKSYQTIGGIPSGVLDLTISDPSLSIVSVEFRTRSGNAGAWSVYAADAAPYSASVALVADEASAIGYRITAYRADGSIGVIRETVVDFPSSLKGSVEARARITGSTPTQTTVTVDAIVPAGAPTPSVMLVAITGSAALASGPAIGVASPSGTAWVFNRGNALGGIGQAQFRATSSGYQSDDDFADIDEQGRDTVPLQVRLQPVAPTATTQPLDLSVVDPIDNTGATATINYAGLVTVLVAGVARASGYSFAITPGAAPIRIEATRPVFGNGVGRVEVLVTKANRVQDTDSADVAPQDRDTILPKGYATVAENGLTATTTLKVNDPQSRRTSVDFAYGYGNAPMVAPVVVAPNGAGDYVYAAPLVEKQPTRIEWRIWGTMPDGTTQVLDSDVIRSSVGAKPGPPDIRPSVSIGGVLEAAVRGDADAKQVRVYVKLDSEPTAAEVDTLGQSFAGRTAPFIHSTPLAANARWYIGVRTYNTDVADPVNPALPGYASDLVTTSDVWTGPSGNKASVKVGREVISDTTITFDQIAFGPLCSFVEVYVAEYRGDPGAVGSVVGVGYRPPGAPIRVSGGAITCAVSIPGNYIVASFVAFDSQNRQGENSSSALGEFSGVVTRKVQSAGAAPGRPNAPQDLAVAAGGIANDTVNVDTTLPAALGGTIAIRVFRDGVVRGGDVAIGGALGGSVFRIIDPVSPNTTYSYQTYTVNAAGQLSAVGSPVRTITLGIGQVPKPVVAMGAFDVTSWSFPVTITPGAGSPSGVTWHVLVKRAPDEVAYVEKTPRTTLTFNLPAEGIVVGGEPHTYTFYLKVWGEKVGYTNSLESDPVSQDVVVS